MKLLGTVRSPFARRVRVALLNQRIAFDWVALNLDELFPPSERLLRANPLGLVPALQLKDDFALVDSSEILNYIDSSLGQLWPRDSAHGLVCRRISSLVNGILTYAVREFQGLRVASPLDGSLESNVRIIERTLDCLESDLSRLPQLGLDNQALWDVAVALDYLDFRLSDKIDWRAGRPQLMAAFERVSGFEVFQETRPVS